MSQGFPLTNRVPAGTPNRSTTAVEPQSFVGQYPSDSENASTTHAPLASQRAESLPVPDGPEHSTCAPAVHPVWDQYDLEMSRSSDTTPRSESVTR